MVLAGARLGKAQAEQGYSCGGEERSRSRFRQKKPRNRTKTINFNTFIYYTMYIHHKIKNLVTITYNDILASINIYKFIAERSNCIQHPKSLGFLVLTLILFAPARACLLQPEPPFLSTPLLPHKLNFFLTLSPSRTIIARC